MFRGLLAVTSLVCLAALGSGQALAAQPRSFLITGGVAIQESASNQETIFLNWRGVCSLLAPGERAYLSSDPAGTGPIIVDDQLLVNGRPFSSYGGTLNDPRGHLGESASTSYVAVDPVDVTSAVAGDGCWYVSAADYGYTFTASRLYLVIR